MLDCLISGWTVQGLWAVTFGRPFLCAERRLLFTLGWYRWEGGGPFAIRVFPDGRSGGSAQAVGRHSGAHPTSAYCGQQGPFMMIRQARQNGLRRDTSGECQAHSRGNGACLAILQAGGRRESGPRTCGTPKNVREVAGTTGGAVQWPNTAQRRSRTRSNGTSGLTVCEINQMPQVKLRGDRQGWSASTSGIETPYSGQKQRGCCAAW